MSSITTFFAELNPRSTQPSLKITSLTLLYNLRIWSYPAYLSPVPGNQKAENLKWPLSLCSAHMNVWVELRLQFDGTKKGLAFGITLNTYTRKTFENLVGSGR